MFEAKKISFDLVCSKAVVLEVFFEKGAVKNFAKLTGKHLWRSLFK